MHPARAESITSVSVGFSPPNREWDRALWSSGQLVSVTRERLRNGEVL